MQSMIVSGACSDPGQVSAVALQHGLILLEDRDIRSARTLAARLVGGEVAPESVFIAVQHTAGAAIFGFFEQNEITALLAAFPVNERGLALLQTGAFDTINIDLSTISAPSETPAAYYGWGFAAATKDGGRAVVKASAQIHRELYWATPTFARAVTADGVRALSSIGFQPTRGGDSTLLWIPAGRFAPGR
jgi:hypothetical protein